MTSQQCAAASVYDMVGIKFGPSRLLMYYQTGFKIAAALCMAAKLAGRYEGVHPRLFQKFISHEDLRARPSTHTGEYRRTQEKPNFEKWTVGGERNIVILRFDDLTVKMHYSDAFKFYTWLRHECRMAKAWAGDMGRQWTTRANLTDAEQNDKFLYVDT